MAAAWVQARFQGRLQRIGPRLLAGFLLLIVPTLALGVFVVQRFDLLGRIRKLRARGEWQRW
jgi:hypothetical protein